MPKENDLEGAQDMGGKHGGQAGQPKPPERPDPRQAEQSGDVPAVDRTTKADPGAGRSRP